VTVRVQQDAPEPRFSISELRELRKALNGALLYVGPVGFSEHASSTWREAKHWKDRIDSLIAEAEEYEIEMGASA
jgi:hypothetical protein